MLKQKKKRKIMDMNFDNIKEQYESKAKEYANDKEKTGELLKEAMKKAKKKGPFEEMWDKLQLLFGIIKDWTSGRYTEIPTGSIVMIIIALLYFVSPIDLIPDFIPGGLIDDAFVLGMVIKQVSSDLEKYREWLAENPRQ